MVLFGSPVQILTALDPLGGIEPPLFGLEDLQPSITRRVPLVRFELTLYRV